MILSIINTLLYFSEYIYTFLLDLEVDKSYYFLHLQFKETPCCSPGSELLTLPRCLKFIDVTPEIL